MTRRRTCALLPLALLCVAWLNPERDRIDAGNRLYKEGKYEDAIGRYGEVLVDDPDSPLLNFNMGTANYKAGKYAEAIASFARVRTGEDDPKRLARTAYNAGNAQYRLGAAAEKDKPQEALKAYAAALVAYRRALGSDPNDQDAKFNYEFVAKKIKDLQEKLEEQKKQQEQHPQDQQEQQNQQDKQEQQDQQDQQGEQKPEPQPDQAQQQEQQDPQQQKPEEEPQAAPEEKQDGGEEKQDQPQQAQAGEEEEQAAEQDDEQAAGGDASTGGEKTDKMSRQEAAALIDTAKDDEVQPKDIARRAQAAGVAEPLRDW